MSEQTAHKIATVMVVAGHEHYHKFASVSIPSFLKGNGNSTTLCVITDNPAAIEPYAQYGDLRIVSWEDAVTKVQDVYDSILRRQLTDYYDRFSRRMEIKYYNLIPTMGQFLLGGEVDHVLKLDCDSFFVGNIVELLEAEIEPEYDLYLVARSDPRMMLRENLLPGAGLYMWPTRNNGAGFPRQYEKHFKHNEQVTISRQSGGLWKIIKTKTIANPSLHMVYPFTRNPAFSKRDAEVFGAAYFHLTGPEAYSNQLKMEAWFDNG